MRQRATHHLARCQDGGHNSGQLVRKGIYFSFWTWLEHTFTYTSETYARKADVVIVIIFDHISPIRPLQTHLTLFVKIVAVPTVDCVGLRSWSWTWGPQTQTDCTYKTRTDLTWSGLMLFSRKELSQWQWRVHTFLARLLLHGTLVWLICVIVVFWMLVRNSLRGVLFEWLQGHVI